jgi:hypothetical protein
MKLDPGMHIGLHLIFFGKNRCDIKNNAELAERVAKLATRLAELEAAAQKKPSS